MRVNAKMKDSKTLRPYQKDIVDRANKSTGNILIQAPTGAGKTFIAQKIVQHHKSKNKKSLFLAPKLNLLDQTAKAFVDLNPQVIHASNKKELDINSHAFVSTIQTMSRRPELLESMKFDYIILDEMHYGAKGKMQEVIKNVHTGRIIGLSATPYDSDGKLLTDDFDTIINDYDTQYMVDNAYLVDVKSYEAYTPNLEGVKTKQGDWDTLELDHRFNTPEVISKVVSVTKDTIKKRDRAIAFCINISHAEAMTDAYLEAGLNAAVTHSKLKKDEQEKVMNDFRKGKLKVLVSVDQLTTGFDVPATDTIVLARSTQSQNLYKQIVGRALRLSPETKKKEAVLLDCGGIISRLGMPLNPIIEKTKKHIERKPYACKKCKSVKSRIFEIKDDKTKPVTICPECKDEIEFEPKFLYRCQSCERYYDFKNDNSNFSFKDDNMKLNCSCGEITDFGSLNDDSLDFRELLEDDQVAFHQDRLHDKKISENSLNELSKHENIHIRIEVARHPKTSRDTLVRMAKEDFEVFNPESFLNNNKIGINEIIEIIDYKKDSETLKEQYGRYTSTGYSRMVLKSIVHKKSTDDLISVIAKHKDVGLLTFIIEYIKSVTKTEIPRRHYNEKQKYDTKPLSKKYVKNVEMILELLSDKDELKREVAKNKYISIKTLKKLLKDDDENIKRILQNHPNFSINMLDENMDEMDYYTRIKYSEKKGLSKELQLQLAKSTESDIKINLLKNYKSKAVFLACIESVPGKDEKVEEAESNRYFLEEILKNRNCTSSILKNLITIKHQHMAENLRYISNDFRCRKDFKSMIEEAFEDIQKNQRII